MIVVFPDLTHLLVDLIVIKRVDFLKYAANTANTANLWRMPNAIAPRCRRSLHNALRNIVEETRCSYNKHVKTRRPKHFLLHPN